MLLQLPNLTRELLRRGYSETDVDKILGGNMLRVMEAVKQQLACGGNANRFDGE